MRLTRLTIQGIRGFNGTRTIEFAPDLNLIYGANGSGKTSVAEALEWLLYGRTAKRTKGDELSKREYAGSYRNVHYGSPDDPFVELCVELPDGSLRTLRRELHTDERSSATLDGGPCSDFAALGLASELDRPMILQDGLRDLIHSKPKERYRALSSLLGLDALMVLRGHIDKLQGPAGYAKQKPKRATEARALLHELQEQAAQHAEAASLCEALDNGPNGRQDPRAELNRLVAEVIGEGVPDHSVLSALGQERSRRERAVLDWGPYEAPALEPETEKRVHNCLGLEAEEAREVLDATTAATSGARSDEERRARQFYGLGLGLVDPENRAQCPFCRAQTLTPKRRGEIEEEIQAGARGPEDQAKLIADLAALDQRIPSPSTVLPGVPDEAVLAALRTMLPDEQQRLAVFEQSAERVAEYSSSLQARHSAVTQAARDLRERLEGRPLDADASAELPRRIEALGTQLRDAVLAVRTYSGLYSGLAAAIEQCVSTREEVRYIDFLMDAWRGWPSVEIAAHDCQIESSLLEFQREVREFISRKQEEALQVRGGEINEWYECLNPQEPVGFSNIRVATDSLQLVARSWDKEMHAAANLSSSHLNCLGLAVYLACATRPGTPCRFLIIDDPVQSMDEQHSEAFQIQVLGKLLGADYQIVVLSHLENLTSSVDTRYRGRSETLRLRFGEYTPDGPTVEERPPRLEGYLKSARRNMAASNVQYQSEAIQNLRRFVERFVKDLYVRETDRPISRRYKDASWPELKGLLRQCRSFDPSDELRLETTHSFASKYRHEDDTVPSTVPQQHLIKPHVDDMYELLEKYRALLGL